MDEGAQRKERTERRRNERVVEMGTGEPPEKKKRKKKSKPRDISEVDLENAPACSSTPIRSKEKRFTNLDKFPTFPIIEENTIPTSPEPVRQLLMASSVSSKQPNKETTPTFDLQEFMIGQAMKTSEGIKDLKKRLQQIEDKISNRTDNIENGDRVHIRCMSILLSGENRRGSQQFRFQIA